MSDGVRWAWRPQEGPQQEQMPLPIEAKGKEANGRGQISELPIRQGLVSPLNDDLLQALPERIFQR